jgi:iron complex outermembrane recepter protein
MKSKLSTRTLRKLVSSTALATIASLAAGAAWAQEADDSTTIEEVVVTAQFREQNLQETPLSITAMSAEMLESRNQTNIVDVTNQAPNVTLKPGSAPFGPSIQAFIRGVGQYDFNFALEPGVGMYVDDVYYATLTGSAFDLLDLERVEVLRGPQGTLSGMNSIGGAVKIYSKRPNGQGGGFVEAKYGSYDRVELRAAADFTVIPDQLFVRLSGVSHQSDGYVTSYDYRCTHPTATGVPSLVTGNDCKLGTEGGKSYNALRGAIRWTPTDRLEINIIGDVTKDNSEAGAATLLYVGTQVAAPNNGLSLPGTGPTLNPLPLSGPPAGPPGGVVNQSIGGINYGDANGSAFISYSPLGAWAKDTFSNSPYVNYSTYCDSRPVDGVAPYCVPRISQVDSWGFSATIDFKISDNLGLKYIGSYREYDADFTTDEGTPIGVSTLRNTLGHWQQSQELRLNGNFIDDRLNFTVGAYLLDRKSTYDGRIGLPGFAFIEADTVPADTWALFANVEFKITDQLTVIGGARYTDMEKTFYFGRLGSLGNTYAGGVSPAVGPLNGQSGTYKGDRKDYRVVAQYKLNDDIMVYGSIATGFKGGGVNPRPFFVQQALPHNPEELLAYEAGVKSDWFDRRLRLNASVFLNEYKDILISLNNCTAQAGVGFGVPCAMPINAGDADVKGLEIELFARPVDGLTIDASYSLLDFEFTFLTGCVVGLNAGCTANSGALGAGMTYGMRMPFTPKEKWSIGAQYEIPVGDFGTLTPRLDWSFQSSFFSQPLNSHFTRVDDYHMLNGRLTLNTADGDWQAALEVKNIADKVYYFSYFDNRGSTRAVVGAIAPPRTWAVSIKRSF